MKEVSDDKLAATPIAYECEFTVESRGGCGGDFERNIGGMQGEKRVRFKGYASPELYGALIDAMREVTA